LSPRKRFNSPNSASRDCLMSSFKRAKRPGLGLVFGFVTAPELPGPSPLKRRLSFWAAPLHRPDSPCRNCRMSSPRTAKRSAADFVGFVIGTSTSRKGMICDQAIAPRRPTTGNPFDASHAPGVQRPLWNISVERVTGPPPPDPEATWRQQQAEKASPQRIFRAHVSARVRTTQKTTAPAWLWKSPLRACTHKSRLFGNRWLMSALPPKAAK